MGILNKIVGRLRAKSVVPKSTMHWACANRRGMTCDYEGHEVTVTVRDKGQPDGYSREELVVMLATVREHERLTGWRVPEPVDSPSESVPPPVPREDAPSTLNVRDAGRILRGLARLQNELSSLRSQRYAATYDRDYEAADSLLLGIGLRVAKHAGGLQNPDLVAEWRGDNCPTCHATMIGRPRACPTHGESPPETAP